MLKIKFNLKQLLAADWRKKYMSAYKTLNLNIKLYRV